MPPKWIFVLATWTLVMVALMGPALLRSPWDCARVLTAVLAGFRVPVLPAKIGDRSAEEADLLSSKPALWSSVVLACGGLCGQAALWVCDRGRTSSLRMLRIMSSGASWQEVLSHMPATVSETIHDTTSPHGTAFKGLMLILALLILASEYPKYELYPIHAWDESDIVFNAMRSICPTVGVVMLVFIPSNHDLLRMMDRCKDPHYRITEEDRNIFLSSGIQDSLHAVGGVISFLASTVLEFLHLNRALWGSFFTHRPNGSMVYWRDGTTASDLWLALAALRYFVLISIIPCAVRFAYETKFEPTERCRWLNPDYSYLPERMLIAELAANVMLTGTSICFVNREAWEKSRRSTQWILLVVTGIEIAMVLTLTLWTCWFSVHIHAYLSDAQMSKRVRALMRKHRKAVSENARSMRKLSELQQRIRRRVASMEAKEDSGETGEDEDVEYNDGMED